MAVNPTFQQLQYSDLDISVAGSADAIMMVEGGAVEVPEAQILEALQVGHKAIKELVRAPEGAASRATTSPDMEWTPVEPDPAPRTGASSPSRRRGSPAPTRQHRRLSRATTWPPWFLFLAKLPDLTPQLP